MFGSGTKFDLTHAVYAREGSAFFLIENYYSHLLQLSSYKPGAWMDSNPFLFSLRTWAGGREVSYSYRGDPGSILLTVPQGQVEMIFTYDADKKLTGVIANVINMMASYGGGGIVGAIIFIIVFIFGHLLNLGINALGAYVHTNRLQYVEFFGKFYDAGGKKFTPFKTVSKYVQVKEEK